jgi:hypothetical protein
MKATDINMYGGSGDAFISGTFATESATTDLTHNFIDGLSTILEELVMESTDEFRQAAMGDAEWKVLAPYMEVDLVQGELTYGHVGSGSVDAVVTSLEYGGPESTPNPLIRSFAQENRQKFADEVSKRIEKDLDFG